MKENLSVKLAVTDMFWKYVYVGEGSFGETNVNDGYKWDNRVLTLSLSYRFGKRIVAMLSSDSKNTVPEGSSKKR